MKCHEKTGKWRRENWSSHTIRIEIDQLFYLKSMFLKSICKETSSVFWFIRYTVVVDGNHGDEAPPPPIVTHKALLFQFWTSLVWAGRVAVLFHLSSTTLEPSGAFSIVRSISCKVPAKEGNKMWCCGKRRKNTRRNEKENPEVIIIIIGLSIMGLHLLLCN